MNREAQFAFAFFPFGTALFVMLCTSIICSAKTNVGGQPPSSSTTIEEVLVTGVRPGPGLWRVSKGNHDLWILATLVPLPKGMTWRSQQVETRIASSRIVLAPPEITADVSFFHNPRFEPALVNARKSPNGETLEQELPPEFYTRWLALKERYLGKDNYDEQTRPLFAALNLFQHAIDQSGLTSSEDVWNLVLHMARSRHVPVSPVTIKLQFDSPATWIQEFNKIPREQEVECLEKTIERIEIDLQPMRQRANLWSVGDIEGLRAMQYPDDRVTCFNALFSVPRMHDQLAQADARLTELWLETVGDALDRYSSSFAVLPVGDLLRPNGWLSQLRAKGYAIEDPR
jgi:uncharacterized protein YbaP (TraB family)